MFLSILLSTIGQSFEHCSMDKNKRYRLVPINQILAPVKINALCVTKVTTCTVVAIQEYCSIELYTDYKETCMR